MSGTKIIDLQIKWEGGFWDRRAGVFTWASKARTWGPKWLEEIATITGNEYISRGFEAAVKWIREVRKQEMNC